MQQRMLLIDDDNDDASLFLEALSEVDPSANGYCFHNAQEAIAKMLNGQTAIPDVIFLDINLPGMSGWDCLKTLKKDPVLNSIPVIVYSTSSNKKDATTAIELDAIGFITKPHDYKALKNMIQKILTCPTHELKETLKRFSPAF